MSIKCRVHGCGHTEQDFLGDHLVAAHKLSVDDYLASHAGAPIVSERVLTRLSDPALQREAVRAEDMPKFSLCGMAWPVRTNVPATACLPMPDHYRLPTHGQLAKDIVHAMVAIFRGRSIYIHGRPGSGKDGLIHYLSAALRWPAITLNIKRSTDIEAAFFTRAFDQNGTSWEEGVLLKALRDGYTAPDGTVIPYIILLSDLDRADPDQAEHLRLVTDSIQGRITGPTGETYLVLPGTRIIATGNSSGAGDEEGRCITSNQFDSSIMDRIERKIEFHWMDWLDEGPVCKAKFPLLVEQVPGVFDHMGRATASLRTAIFKGTLDAEYSHRAVCSILGHAEDLLYVRASNRPVDPDLLGKAAVAWLDGCPDRDIKEKAKSLMDAHFKGGLKGSAPTGATSTPLAAGFQ